MEGCYDFNFFWRKRNGFGATILLLPVANMTALEHSLLTFTVAGVTLLSFLIGILILPRLATGPAHTTNHYMQIAILNDVVRELEKT